jgi:RimJ/RimL family protein N-acetyltransferase
LIKFGDVEHGARIAAAIPRRFNPACDPVISNLGVTGELLGGVIYDGYTTNCIFMHQASFSKHWLTRDMLWAVFDYPFRQLKCAKVCGTIPSSNRKLLAFNERLGFVVEASIKDAYPDGDMLVLSMKRDNCPWLNIKPRAVKAGGDNSNER